MSPIQYRLDGSVACIQMDDGKANALSETMLDELTLALTRAESEASAVVLSGRSGRFCGGFDLTQMKSGPDGARLLVRRGAELILRLYGSPLPIVAACTGHAIAAGAILLLASDVRIGAAGEFRIGLNEVSIGLPLPLLGMEIARDRLATAVLCRATLLAHLFDPVTAVTAGFLDRVVPAAELAARANEEAAKLAALGRMAYGGTKQRLRGRTIEYIRATLDEDTATLQIGA